MTTPNEQARADAYTRWCEENDRDPYDPQAGRDYADVEQEADHEQRRYREDNARSHDG